MKGPDELERLLAGREPEAFRHRYLALPSDDLRVTGTTVPALGTRRMQLLPGSDLAIPSDAAGAAPIDYMACYVTASQYLAPAELGAFAIEDVIRTIAHGLSVPTTLVHLGLINSTLLDEGRLAELESEILSMLQPVPRSRLENVLAGRSGDGARHVLLARQPILAAIRYTLLDEGASEVDSNVPPVLGAVLLVHALSETLGTDDEAADTELEGVPDSLFFEILRLGLLYQTDDMWSSIDRIVRLWRIYGSRIGRTPLRATPCELLRESTELELVELLGLGFALYAHASLWEPGRPPFVDRDMGSDMSPNKLKAFRRLVAASVDDLRDRFRARSGSPFDFLPLQETPVLDLDAGLLVLDPGFLWDRVTTGLYWLVHDAEKARSERDRLHWSQGFAEAVELMAEDSLSSLAPVLMNGDTTMYEEEEIGAAYGAKRCDAAVDFGDHLLLAEIVSGQLSIGTRIDGAGPAFEADTERLVIKKCRQLDEVATAVLGDNASALTGVTSRPAMKLVPLVVVGGGYPINPLTVSYIEQALERDRLLVDPRIAPLCIIDLAELEMLEGLAESGPDPISVLMGWKASGIAAVSLRNFVLKEHDAGRHLRPSRMKDSVDATFDEVLKVLDLREKG